MKIFKGENEEIINSIKQSNKNIDVEIIDYNESSFKNIIKKYYTISLFEKTKIYIIINPLFLINKTNSLLKKEIPAFEKLSVDTKNESFEKEKKSFEKNISSKKNEIYFIVNKDINSKISYVKNNLKEMEIKNFNELSLMKEYAKNKNILVDTQTIKYLIENIEEGYSKKQELLKIALLNLDKNNGNLIVEKKDLEENLVLKSSVTIFKFIEEIINDNYKKAYEIYNVEIKKLEYDDLQILPIMFSQIKFILQVKILKKKHLSNQQIAATLKTSPYRIQMNEKIINKITIIKIKNVINKIAHYEYMLKSGRSFEEEVILNFLY